MIHIGRMKKRYCMVRAARAVAVGNSEPVGVLVGLPVEVLVGLPVGERRSC